MDLKQKIEIICIMNKRNSTVRRSQRFFIFPKFQTRTTPIVLVISTSLLIVLILTKTDVAGKISILRPSTGRFLRYTTGWLPFGPRENLIGSHHHHHHHPYTNNIRLTIESAFSRPSSSFFGTVSSLTSRYSCPHPVVCHDTPWRWWIPFSTQFSELRDWTAWFGGGNGCDVVVSMRSDCWSLQLRLMCCSMRLK